MSEKRAGCLVGIMLRLHQLCTPASNAVLLQANQYASALSARLGVSIPELDVYEAVSASGRVTPARSILHALRLAHDAARQPAESVLLDCRGWRHKLWCILKAWTLCWMILGASRTSSKLW